MINWYDPSARLAPGSIPTAPPGANVIVTTLPAWLATRLTAPVGVPGPTRLSVNAAVPPVIVTASEKVTSILVTIDRWAAPPLTLIDVTVGGGVATPGAVRVTSLPSPPL